MDSSSSTYVVAGVVYALLVGVPAIINLWKLFRKANKPGWAAIVPVYNTIILAEIAKKPLWMAIIAAVTAMLSGIPAVGPAFAIVALVFYVLLYIPFIKQYNAGVVFWVTYFLLPIVAVFLVKGVAHKEGVVAAPSEPVAEGATAEPVGGPAATTTEPVAAAEPSAEPVASAEPVTETEATPSETMPTAEPVAPAVEMTQDDTVASPEPATETQAPDVEVAEPVTADEQSVETPEVATEPVPEEEKTDMEAAQSPEGAPVDEPATQLTDEETPVNTEEQPSSAEAPGEVESAGESVPVVVVGATPSDEEKPAEEMGEAPTVAPTAEATAEAPEAPDTEVNPAENADATTEDKTDEQKSPTE